VGAPKLPALVLDDGTALTESLAICRYLESLYPEPNLFGRDPKETAVIEMWTRRAELTLAQPLMMAVRHAHPALAALEPEQSAEIAAFYRRAAERVLPSFDARLGESPFLAADRVTIADIVAAVGLDFARLIRFRPPEMLANLRRWLEAMKARPGPQAGL
jgi:glutathione S-transferase